MGHHRIRSPEVGDVINEVGGVYFICDGGYHKWHCMIPPFKHAGPTKRVMWSEWVESTRKDVECCFGILKCRWKILKDAIMLQSQALIDTVFFGCCILHNLILEFDGLDTRWENDVDWETLNPAVNEDATIVALPGTNVPSQQQVLWQRIANAWKHPDYPTTSAQNMAVSNELVEEVQPGFNMRRE